MRAEKRIKIDTYNILRIVVAVTIACIIACIIISVVSDNPGTAIFNMFLGAFASKRSVSNIFEMAIPLVFTGMAINIAFKAGLFNMGADGSFYMGAITAAFIAINVKLPNGIHQTVMIACAAVVGGVITALPAILKKFTGANELVTSLMFNYVFFNLGMFILNNFMLDDTTGYASYRFPASGRLGNMIQGTQLHWGFLIMIGAWIIMYIVSEKSVFGYKLKLTGANLSFAKYSGIKVTGVILMSQFISGALAGMGGSIEMVGMNSRFIWITAVNYVWDGVLINLLANRKMSLIPISAFFISYMRVGADIMSRKTGVDNHIVSIIQGVIIVLIAAEKFLYFVKQRKEEKEAMMRDSEFEKGAA